jgi:hypothetical protein
MDEHEVIAELGMYWPRGAPSQLRGTAGAYRRAARDIAALQAGCRSGASLVQALNQGPPIDDFASHWVRWQSDQGHFSAAIQACNQLADACDAYARDIDGARHRIIELAAAALRLRRLGPSGAAALSELVAASWAERAALTAAAAQALVAAGLAGSQGTATGGIPGRALPGQGRRTPMTAAFQCQRYINGVGQPVAPVPVAAGLAAGAPWPWRGPATAPYLRGGAHWTPPSGSGARRPGTGGAVAAGIHLLTGAHVDATEVLLGALAGAAVAAGSAAAGSVLAARSPESAGGTPDWVGKVRPPSRRHQASGVSDSTLRKDSNGVISPSVDVQGDVDAIRSGQATYQDHQLADGRFLLPNGRVYGVERLPGGSRMLYPVSGPGIDTLSRAGMKALGVYNRLGDTSRAAAALESNLEAEPADLQAALRVSGTVQGARP